MEKHYTLLKAAELLGVTTQTLRNWDNAGKIRTVRTPGNQRRIPESEIARLTGYYSGEFIEIEHEPQRLYAEEASDINELQVSDGEIHEKAELTEISTENTYEIPSDTIEEVPEFPSVILDNKDKYLLMCKDTPVYDIENSDVINESLLPGCIQKESMNFSEWMETRYSKDTNFSAQRLIHRAFGNYDNEQAAYATGALSLSDCYWVMKQNDSVLFSDVTPYIHKEWDSLSESGRRDDYIWGSLSNLFISGKTDKRWIDSETLLKVDSFREIEPYNLCAALNLDNVTEAHLTNEGIILRNFTSQDIFYESMEQFGITQDDEDSRDMAVEYFKEQAVALFVIDYLIENNDRQTDDYGYLRCTETGEHLLMAPFHNFDRAWSGESIALPTAAWHGYRDYIHDLCRQAIGVARDFEYGTIIERRARKLMKSYT